MKIKDFFGKWGKVQRQKGFSFTHTFEDVENFLEWKSNRALFIANVIFFLCCLFQQNDKSSTFHEGLSAVWPLDPGRILGRDGCHV